MNPRIAAVIAIAIAVAVLALYAWRDDSPDQLQVAARAEAQGELASGVVGTITGDQILVALATSGQDFDQPTLQVFSVGGGDAPEPAGSLPAPVERLDSDLINPPGLALAGDVAYVALAAPDESALWVVDLADPAAPATLAVTSLETPPGAVAVNGNLAAVGPRQGTLVRLFDISDPALPVQVGEYRHAIVTPADLEIVDTTLYLTDKRGIASIDVSEPEDPREIGYWAGEHWRRGIPMTPIETTPRIVASEDRVVAAADLWGVEVLDASDPTDLDETTRKLRRNQIPAGNVPEHAIDVATVGNDLYLLEQRQILDDEPPTWAYRVRQIDISSPGDPQVIAESEDIAGDVGFKSLVAGVGAVYLLNGNQISTMSVN